jgi:hypothetical protein
MPVQIAVPSCTRLTVLPHEDNIISSSLPSHTAAANSSSTSPSGLEQPSNQTSANVCQLKQLCMPLEGYESTAWTPTWVSNRVYAQDLPFL